MKILDKAKELDLIQEVEVVKEVEAKQSKPEKDNTKTREFEDGDYVKVYSLRYGRLNLGTSDPSIPDRYVFTKFMDLNEVRFDVLEAMVRRRNKALFYPWIYIADEDAVKQLRLENTYKNILTPDTIEQVFKLSDKKLLEFIENANADTKRTLRDIAVGKINNDEIANFGTLRLLRDELNIVLKEDIK